MKPEAAGPWLVLAFVVLALVGLFFWVGRSGLPLYAQAQTQTDIRDEILVVPIQVDRDSYGIAMVDTVAQTLWIYEMNNRGPAHSRLRLLAARSWKYDRLLQQYNTDELKPQQVKMLLEKYGPEAEATVTETEQKRVSDVNISTGPGHESGGLNP